MRMWRLSREFSRECREESSGASGATVRSTGRGRCGLATPLGGQARMGPAQLVTGYGPAAPLGHPPDGGGLDNPGAAPRGASLTLRQAVGSSAEATAEDWLGLAATERNCDVYSHIEKRLTACPRCPRVARTVLDCKKLSETVRRGGSMPREGRDDQAEERHGIGEQEREHRA